MARTAEANSVEAYRASKPGWSISFARFSVKFSVFVAYAAVLSLNNLKLHNT